MRVKLGALTWYGGLATAVGLGRRKIAPTLVRLVDVGSGCGLVAFGGLLGYRSLHER